jgi:hypothetical protein
VRKIPQSLKLFFVLILCTAYVYSFSHFGVKAYSLFYAKHTVFPAGTSIASFSIGGKTEDEALQLINSKITDWTKNTNITLQYNNKTIPLDLAIITFHSKETIQNIKGGQNNQLNVTVNEASLTKALNLFNPTVQLNQLNTQKIISKISNLASNLQAGVYVLKLDEFLSDSNKSVEINKVVINPANVPSDLPLAISKLKSIDIKGQTTFSLLEYAAQQKVQNLSSASMSIIASGIYRAILPTNFTILERNTSQEVPEYTTLGYEAKVDSQKNNDFVFANPNETSYQIKLEWRSDGMHVTVFGHSFLSTYKITTDDVQYFPPKTIVQYSPILDPGQKKVAVIGKKGKLIKVYRNEYQNGHLVRKELISDDFYPPIPRVEIHSLAENSGSPDLNQSNQVSNGQSTSSSQTSQNNSGQSINQGNSGGASLKDNTMNSSANTSTVPSEK